VEEDTWRSYDCANVLHTHTCESCLALTQVLLFRCTYDISGNDLFLWMKCGVQSHWWLRELSLTMNALSCLSSLKWAMKSNLVEFLVGGATCVHVHHFMWCAQCVYTIHCCICSCIMIFGHNIETLRVWLCIAICACTRNRWSVHTING